MVKLTNPEQILIDGLKEGNTKVFDYLFNYYYSGLVVFSNRYLLDMAAAEDLVQDFFFQLWASHRTISINQSLKSYFFTSVKNKSLDFLKHQKIGVRVGNELLYLQKEMLEEKDFLVESELDRQLNLALDKLPEKCRQIFMMNRFDGMKPVQIAEKEQLSVRTVEGHIGKAIKILRAELRGIIPSFLIFILARQRN